MHSQPQLSDLVVGSPGGRGLTPLGGQSRLKSEFEVLEGLGQGGFGDVLKVLSVCILCSSWLVSEQARNYLDGRLYAIKRIKLTSGSKMMEKVTREVELLSQMSHEHIVRYIIITLSHNHIPSLHSNIITLSHYHTLTSSHSHITTPSHHHTLTSSHPHIIPPSHYHTLTLSHPHRYYNAWIELFMDEEHQSSLSQSDTDEEETEEECSSGYDDEDDEEDEVSEEDDKKNISVITEEEEEEESDVFTSEYSADLSSSRSLATADIEDSLMDMSIPQLRRYPTMSSLMETLLFSSAVVASLGRRMSHLMV